MPPLLRRTLALAVLLLGTWLIYAQVAEFGYLSYDDDTYITSNAAVRGGLTWDGLRWAFTSRSYACNWHPLTWISHMLDVSLWGLENPGGQHLTNVWIHGLNGVLLVLLFTRWTGSFAASWFLGALFLWHPQRVESVAWLSERKDVLSVGFGLGCLLAYGAWVSQREHQSPARSKRFYLLALFLFAAGLMAKPALVTLPLGMLILDRWPLGRKLGLWASVREKIPFFMLSGAAAGITLWSQSAGGCTAFIAEGLAPLARVENALISSLQYVGALIYPSNLVVFYPHPAVLDPERSRLIPAAISALFLALALGAAWRLRQRAPYLLAGLLWYLVVLFPMSGVVQVGGQAMADRYSYLSTLGLAWIVVFGLRALIAKQAAWRTPVCALAALVLGAFGYQAHAQVGVWRDDLTLFGHAVSVDARNYVAQNALGTHDAMAGQRMLAAGESQAGRTLLRTGVQHLRAACAANPKHFEARVDLGAAQILLGDYAAALENLLAAVQIRPDDNNGQFQLALAFYNLAQFDAALECLDTIRSRDGNYPKLDQLTAVVRAGRAAQQEPNNY